MPYLHLESATWKPKQEKNEQAVAVVRGSNQQVLWLNSGDAWSGKQVVKLGDRETFEVLPNPDPKKRDVIFLTGTSGSGKSHFAKNFIMNYVRLYHNQRKIYIVSQMKSDKTLDEALYMFPKNMSEEKIEDMEEEQKEKFKNPMIKRIPLDPQYWIEHPPNVDDEHFAQTLWVFDDVDAIEDKQINERVESYLKNIATRGRMHNKKQGGISALFITHHTSVGQNKRLKLVMHDSTGYVVYPSSSSAHGLLYLLNKYANVDCTYRMLNRTFKKLGRWVYIKKHYPQILIASKQAELVCKNEDAMIDEDTSPPPAKKHKKS